MKFTLRGQVQETSTRASRMPSGQADQRGPPNGAKLISAHITKGMPIIVTQHHARRTDPS